MAEQWIWFDTITFKRETFMNFESNVKSIKWLISKTAGWDLVEMIAYMCASECLEKKYFD